MQAVAGEMAHQRDQDGISWARLNYSRFRAQKATELLSRKEKAPLGASDFGKGFLADYDRERDTLLADAPTRRAHDFMKQSLEELRGSFEIDAATFESQSRVKRITVENDEAINQAQTYLMAAPDAFEAMLKENQVFLQATSTLPDAIRTDLLTRGRQKLATAAVIGLIQRDPHTMLESLTALPGESGVAAVENLTAEERVRLRTLAEGTLEDHEAARILEVYRADARAGAQAVTALEHSGLPPERLDGIRRKVRSSVDLMQDERLAANIDRLATVERNILAGADLRRTENDLDDLHRQGILRSTQYASLMERAYASAQRTAESAAVTAEITAAIREGIPLDPGNSDHRKFLATAFDVDATRLSAGSPEWRSLALGYAARVRMLPQQAASWLRSAARAPDHRVALAGAEFYGSLEQAAPEASDGIDADARAFLASLSGMVAAGASPEVAFETARQNVYEARADVVQARREQYRRESRDNAKALDNFIDRDFDTWLTRQPTASVVLAADFDRQTAEYYAKTGDVALARDLAWKDVKRVYGPSYVNGAPMMIAFPPERFGITPADVRADLETYLGETKRTDVKAEDILVVPDGLTLRLVNDALTGQPVQPSYRLVTPTGDVLTDTDGIPVRYTLPSVDELTRRVEAAQAKAAADAQAAIDKLKRRRELLEQAREQPPVLPLP